MINYMSNEKAMIILLTAGLVKNTQHKWKSIFQNKNILVEEQKCNQICLIMQPKQTQKMQQFASTFAKNNEDKINDITNFATNTTVNVKINQIKYITLVTQSTKMTIKQKLMKQKRKLLIMIMIKILLLQNLIS